MATVVQLLRQRRVAAGNGRKWFHLHTFAWEAGLGNSSELNSSVDDGDDKQEDTNPDGQD